MQKLQIYNYQMKSVACLFLIAMSLVSLFSCSEDASNRELAEALFLAGDNKPQLDSVLKHYADEPEKLSAARFLISNMPGHYSCADTAAIEQYYRYVDTLVTKYHDMPVDKMASVMDRLADKLRIDTLGYVQDLKIVTADFLIRNIDDAFVCWRETPWAQHLTFEEFCEYILPYKTCELQPLVHWRDMFSNYNQRHLSDFQQVSDSEIRAGIFKRDGPVYASVAAAGYKNAVRKLFHIFAGRAAGFPQRRHSDSSRLCAGLRPSQRFARVEFIADQHRPYAYICRAYGRRGKPAADELQHAESVPPHLFEKP